MTVALADTWTMDDEHNEVDADRQAARVVELTAQLDQARARAAEADQHLAAAELNYAATGDGIAESMRAIELSASSRDRRRLLAGHVAAEQVAAAEYQTRLQRWGRNVVGSPQTLPLGEPVSAATLIARLGVLGYYRIDPVTDTQKVTLFLAPSDPSVSRPRRHLTRAPGQHCLTIAEAIRALIVEAPDRLVALVGGAAAAELTASVPRTN